MPIGEIDFCLMGFNLDLQRKRKKFVLECTKKIIRIKKIFSSGLMIFTQILSAGAFDGVHPGI